MKKKTIIFYGIPAYGHLHSNLYFTRCLAESGFWVIYYSMEPFRREIEANDCIFRAYPLKGEPDLSDGSRLLRLYRLILEYTRDMLPILLAEAEAEDPCAVIFDSLALWGRAVGTLLSVSSCSFYSIAAIGRIGDAGFRAYASGFSSVFLQNLTELPRGIRIRRELKQAYGIKKLGILPVLMNKGSRNLMGYSRSFQPGGSSFGKDYTFLGPLAVYRKRMEKNDFICLDGTVIYISLGTVFNQDEHLLEQIEKQFGSGKRTGFHIIMAWDMEKAGQKTRPVMKRLESLKHFTIRSFINQAEVMEKASLFITAGGMNSIHEALYYGVPCLFCPQQGEQRLNARQFERMGFGRILKAPENLFQEGMQAIGLKDRWNEELRNELLRTNIKEAVGQFLRQEGHERNK